MLLPGELAARPNTVHHFPLTSHEVSQRHQPSETPIAARFRLWFPPLPTGSPPLRYVTPRSVYMEPSGGQRPNQPPVLLFGVGAAASRRDADVCIYLFKL